MATLVHRPPVYSLTSNTGAQGGYTASHADSANGSAKIWTQGVRLQNLCVFLKCLSVWLCQVLFAARGLSVVSWGIQWRCRACTLSQAALWRLLQPRPPHGEACRQLLGLRSHPWQAPVHHRPSFRTCSEPQSFHLRPCFSARGRFYSRGYTGPRLRRHYCLSQMGALLAPHG